MMIDTLQNSQYPMTNSGFTLKAYRILSRRLSRTSLATFQEFTQLYMSIVKTPAIFIAASAASGRSSRWSPRDVQDENPDSDRNPYGVD